MRFKTTVIAMMLFAVSAAFADEALPGRPAEPVKSEVRIYIDPDADQAKIVISREMLEALNGGGAVGSAGVPGASRLQAMFAGVLLSASFIVGGIWLSRKRTGKAVAAAAGICVAGAAIAFANIAPPVYRTIDSGIFSEQLRNEKFARGEILVEVSDEQLGEGVQLIVPVKKGDKKKSRK